MFNKFRFIIAISFVFILSLSADEEIPTEICSPTETYKVEKKLGEGVFGNVYAVKDSKGRRYAIKSYKIHEEEALANSLFANAWREYQLGQTLNHPNIVKVLDFFHNGAEIDSPNQIYYMVMEFVEGDTLFNTPRKTINHRDAMSSSKGLMSALKYALSMNLLYIDLHGNNVILNKSHLKVVDIASFFSFDELLGYIFSIDTSYENYEYSPSAMDPKVARVGLNPEKLKKLNAYFKENPKQLDFLKRVNLAVNDFAAEVEEPSKEEKANQALAYYFSLYIAQITDIVAEVHARSNCTKEDKVNLKVKLKSIVWGYEEDFYEGKYYPMDLLLEKINKSL